MPAQLLLHIGSNKCGSSALQTALSQHRQWTDRQGRTIAYAGLDENGTLLHGDALGAATARSLRGYTAAPHPQHLARFTTARLRELSRQFAAVEADTLIVSHEAWRSHGPTLRDHLLPAFPVPITAVIYVRPQVSYLNAGWWQWGAWQDVPLAEWIHQRIPDIQWHESIVAFQETTGIEDVRIRLLPREIVGDFFELLDADPPQRASRPINSGLSPALLRLFQRHRRRLRPGPHASGIDFVLSRHLPQSVSSPWVLEQQMVQFIVEQSEESNRSLLRILDPEQAAIMQSDPRWWSASAFADKRVEPWNPQPPQADELDELCAQMARIILEFEQRSRR